MKKNIIKIMSIIMFVFLIMSFITYVEASMGNSVRTSFAGGNVNAAGSKSVINIISAVLSIVRTVGAAVAIVMLMTIAAKYIMASAGDRADLKKYAVNYVIGALILFGATGILGIVQKFVNASLT